MKRAMILCCMMGLVIAISGCSPKKKASASLTALGTAVVGVVAAKVVDTSLDVSKTTMKTMGNTFKKLIPKPSWFKIPFLSKAKAAIKKEIPHTHPKKSAVKVKETIQTEEAVTINAKPVMTEDHTCCIAVECTTGEDFE